MIIKKSFWETSHQQSLPSKKEESASSKIYKILKAVKDRNLQRRLRKSVNESGEPSDSLYSKGYNRKYDEVRPQQWCHKAGHSKAHFDVGGHRYSTPKRQQVWVLKRPKYPEGHKEDRNEKTYKGRLKSHVQKLSPDKKTSVDMTTPEKEECSVYNESPDSPVIHWKRRSQLRDDLELDENDDYYDDDDDEVKGYIDPMDVEVVQMVDHVPERANQRHTRRSAMLSLHNEEQLRDDQEQAASINKAPEQEEIEEEEAEEVVKRLQLEMQSMQQKKDLEIHHLNTRLDEMSNMMKQLFGQLGMMTTINQPSVANAQGNIQTTLDRRLEELQEPTLITPKEDEIVSKVQIENLISQKGKENRSKPLIQEGTITEDKKGKALQEDEGGWETFISKKTKQMMNVLLAIEGIRRKSALELEVDPRLLSSKNSVAGGPSSSKKKSLKYFKDQKGKHKFGSKSQKEKKKKLARKKTMIQKYINSTDEYQQPPRRPVMLEEYMADLFLDSESEEEGSIPIETCRVISISIETCRVISKRGGRAARGRNIPLDICKADVKISSKEVHSTPAPFTDSDEELHFPDEESDHKGKKTLKERCPKLGSSSDSEEVEDMEISKNSQAEACSSSEVTQIQLRSEKQVSLPQKKIKDKEKNIQLNEAVVPQESLKPKVASANAVMLDKGKLKDKDKSKSKQISPVPHLGSDTEEDDISTSFKPLVIGKRRSELSTVPFDYEANHANKPSPAFACSVDLIITVRLRDFTGGKDRTSRSSAPLLPSDTPSQEVQRATPHFFDSFVVVRLRLPVAVRLRCFARRRRRGIAFHLLLASLLFGFVPQKVQRLHVTLLPFLYCYLTSLLCKRQGLHGHSFVSFVTARLCSFSFVD
ncbi:hypothetical protein M5K25_019519 [Dendrobium thyrsiflorum]|uniref:Uncharacterized protein n=1 Tax=Dendrobium thyrsiflorum TaxID=117978 RepID=A0ABD0UM91_DENTH